MDLGDFFGGVVDLGQSYITSKFSQPSQPMQYLPTQSNFTNQGLPATVTAVPSGVVAPPGVSAPTGGCGAQPVYKKVCGVYKWVTPKRRRRKQLVTMGDAKGLATLKGILGNGKSMEVWIATHGG